MAIIQPTQAPPDIIEEPIVDDSGALLADGSTPDDTVLTRGVMDTYKWTLANGDTTEWIYTSGFRKAFVVTTSQTVWEIGDYDKTIARQINATGLIENSTATKAGYIQHGCMPPFLRIKSGANSNAVTLYLMR
jgi:hypothetical protein